MPTLDELRIVADKLKESHSKPIKLTKEQAEYLNSNLADGCTSYKEGELHYHKLIYRRYG